MDIFRSGHPLDECIGAAEASRLADRCAAGATLRAVANKKVPDYGTFLLVRLRSGAGCGSPRWHVLPHPDGQHRESLGDHHTLPQFCVRGKCVQIRRQAKCASELINVQF